MPSNSSISTVAFGVLTLGLGFGIRIIYDSICDVQNAKQRLQETIKLSEKIRKETDARLAAAQKQLEEVRHEHKWYPLGGEKSELSPREAVRKHWASKSSSEDISNIPTPISDREVLCLSEHVKEVEGELMKIPPIEFKTQTKLPILSAAQEKDLRPIVSEVLVRSWKLENKEIEFYVERPRDYQAIVRTEKGVYVLSKEQIRGLPKNISENLERLKSFLSKTHVTLNPSSDDSYSLEISQKGDGGLSSEEQALIACAVFISVTVIGVCLYKGYMTIQQAKKRLEMTQDMAKKERQEADARLEESQKKLAEVREQHKYYHLGGIPTSLPPESAVKEKWQNVNYNSRANT